MTLEEREALAEGFLPSLRQAVVDAATELVSGTIAAIPDEDPGKAEKAALLGQVVSGIEELLSDRDREIRHKVNQIVYGSE